MAVKQGFLAPQEIAGELGQVLAGQKPGRTGDGDITVFDTTGIALQDLAAAACALRRWTWARWCSCERKGGIR